MIGAQPISSFEDGTTEAIVAAEHWDGLVGKVLSEYPWRFAALLRQLSRLADDPPAPWAGIYNLSVEPLTIENVTVNGCSVDYERMGKRLLIDAEAEDVVMLEAIQRVDETEWPDYFTACIRYELAEIFATSVAEDAQMAAFFARKTETAKMLGRTRDSQGRTPLKIGTGRLRRFVNGGKR